MGELTQLQKRDLMRDAYLDARYSPDPSTQNGAVIVTLMGCDPNPWISGYGHNDFPMNVRASPERLERPLKYKFIEHAERNAIFMAVRDGVSTDGATMVCNWAACPDCARAIIQAGIRKLIVHKDMHDRTPDHWRGEIELAHAMLREAGVEIEFLEGKIGECGPVRMNGQEWEP